MGLTAIVSSASSAATSLLSPVGAGLGGAFVAGALLALLIYYDLLGADASDRVQARRTALMLIVPLGLTFGAIVVFQSLQIL